MERAVADPAVGFIALLDDDERVEPGWLEALLQAQSRTGADIVAGAVVPEFERAPASWMLQSKAYRRDTTTDGIVDELYGDANTLFARRLLCRVKPPLFDPAFSFTGGHDTLFFKQARALGVTFARASKARVFEFYPAARMTLRWMLRRAYRTGVTSVLINRRLGLTLPDRLAETGKLLAALVLSPVEALLFIFSPPRSCNALWRLFRAFGKIGGLIGHRYEEYRYGARR
jgi:succinoglycan biosynthesis protein ExoM